MSDILVSFHIYRAHVINAGIFRAIIEIVLKMQCPFQVYMCMSKSKKQTKKTNEKTNNN